MKESAIKKVEFLFLFRRNLVTVTIIRFCGFFLEGG